MQRIILNTLAGAVAAVSLSLSVTGVERASAQYPPPTGNVTFSGETTANPGDTVTFTMKVLDAAGQPAPNRACALSITGQPGADASVTLLSPTTDADGVLRGKLSVGSKPGTVTVTATCDGGVLGVYTVNVPQVAGLPATGSGASPSTAADLSVVAALLMAAAGAAAVIRGASLRRRSAL